MVLYVMLCCRSPVNQIEAPDAICAQVHFKNVFSHTFFTDTYIAPIDIVIRSGDSGETIATGPLSSICVELVVLPGDFEKEDWTAEEFKDKVVSPRKNKGNLLTGTKEITLKSGVGTFNDIKFTDISGKTTSSGRFRFGVKVLQGNDIQDRIMEARSEPFVVRDKRGECKSVCFFQNTIINMAYLKKHWRALREFHKAQSASRVMWEFELFHFVVAWR